MLVGGRYLRAFFTIWTFHTSAIFAEGPYPEVKFKEKLDKGVAEPI